MVARIRVLAAAQVQYDQEFDLYEVDWLALDQLLNVRMSSANATSTLLQPLQDAVTALDSLTGLRRPARSLPSLQDGGALL